ncbi:MAG: alpha-glucosidase family protein [Pseudomonadota bacterium]
MTEPSSAPGAFWWRGAVIYQIYPRSFADSNGDGIGDLPGIIEKLDYIADLGVDGIWLSPFYTSPMKDFGYDVADYCDVDPIFGTLADFDRLAQRAHDLGLKIIIDQVYSHTSDRHDWFRNSRSARDSEKSDWYVWAEAKPDGSPPNNWLSVFGGPAWSWDTKRRQYYLHNFLAEQPDLNFHNPAVQDALLNVARFWMDRGVDGFRLDVANYYFHDQELRDNPASGSNDPGRPYGFQQHLYNRSRPETIGFLERLRATLDTYDARMTVAEIASSSNLARSIEYTEGDHRLHTAYNFHLLECSEPSAAFIQSALEAWQGVDAWPSWSLSNHDVKRSLSRWGADCETPARAKLLVALLLTLRGTIFLYQGEELGLPQADVPFDDLRDPEAIRFWPDNLGRDGSRTPMPWLSNAPEAGFSDVAAWLPASPQHRALAVDVQKKDPTSVASFVKRLLSVRRHLPALIDGDITFIPVPGGVLAFERRSKNERVFCAFNLSADANAQFELPMYAETEPIEIVCQGTKLEDGSVQLEPNGVFFARARNR